uniref:Heat shock protein 70 n=1 Tax=Panagrolaimus sp. ES5 TaxID=591445 RepID=A0AC34GXA5_9BILA
MNDKLIKKFKSEWTFDLKGNRPKGNLCEYIVNDTTKPISAISVSGAILKSIKEAAEKRFDKRPLRAVITVPAYFSTEQKKATQEAAQFANLNVIRIITEPTAAAIGYGLGHHKYKDGEKLFVFDLGGGTFDVTIMTISKQCFKSEVVRGDFHLGGRDFDHLIFEWMKQKLAREGKNIENLHQKKRYRMMLQAQVVKEALSVSHETPVILSDIFETATSPILTRKEFEAMSKHLLKKLETECQAALQAKNLKAKDIDHVLFVGGSSRMPMVATMLKNIFFDDKKFSKVVNPDEVVAAGAAYYAAACMKASKIPEIAGLVVIEVLPLSIGVEVSGQKFKPILHANTEVPCENSFELKTTEDNQRSASIPIYEGLSEKIEENKFIAEIMIPELPPGKAGTVKANVKLNLQLSGMLTAVATVNGVAIDVTIQYSTPFEVK